MSDFTNELLRLSEMREKGLISQEEFELAKAKLFGNSQAGNNETASLPELPTTVMKAVPPSPVPPSPPPASPPPASVPPLSASSSPTAPKAVPPGIAGWSWGAFLWNWIWAIFNNTWIGLLALIPGVNLIMIFVLGVKGREWAWKNKQWESVEHFNRVQRKWSVWGIGLVLASLLLSGLLIAFSMFFLASEGSKFSAFNVPPTTESSETAPESGQPMSIESTPADITASTIATDAASTEAVAPEAVTEEAVDQSAIIQEPVALDNAAEQDRERQEELARTRAEAAAAKAEAAKAKKEALKAEKTLAEQKRREREEEERLAQERAEQEQMQCPYSRAQPLICSSRQGQPAYCDWNFRACGNPRIAKKESKTTCEGKVEWDTGNSQLIVTEGCRAQFVPVQ